MFFFDHSGNSGSLFSFILQIRPAQRQKTRYIGKTGESNADPPRPENGFAVPFGGQVLV